LLGPRAAVRRRLLRIVAGFETPDSGRIAIGGRDLLEVPAHRREMGVRISELRAFPAPHRGLGNVAFGMKLAAAPGAGGAWARRRVSAHRWLEESSNKYPRQLSGGQQQRVALARALAIEPKMLLLDRAAERAGTAVVRVSLRDEIRRVQTTLGVTTLYVTHDQEEALAISDRIVVMRDGRDRAGRHRREIYGRPASRFVAGFIGKMRPAAGYPSKCRKHGVIRCGVHTLRVPPGALEGLAEGTAVTVAGAPRGDRDRFPDNGAPPVGSNAFSARIEAVDVSRLGTTPRSRCGVASISLPTFRRPLAAPFGEASSSLSHFQPMPAG